jgi:hypothetical protein
MNGLIEGFKECAYQAGEICSFPNGRLIRDFGLSDFLENDLQDGDDGPTIAVKALAYFCEDVAPDAPITKFAVLTIGIFLNHYHAKRKKAVPQQALKDLVALMRQKANEQQYRAWIAAHF